MSSSRTDPVTSSAPVYLDGPSARTKAIPLTWPFAIGDKEYRELRIRRITGHEAKEYFASVMSSLRHGTELMVFPGLDIGPEVWAAVDDDDVLRVEEAIEEFLPERFRSLAEALQAIPAAGETDEEPHTGSASEAGAK